MFGLTDSLEGSQESFNFHNVKSVRNFKQKIDSKQVTLQRSDSASSANTHLADSIQDATKLPKVGSRAKIVNMGRNQEQLVAPHIPKHLKSKRNARIVMQPSKITFGREQGPRVLVLAKPLREPFQEHIAT